MRIIGLTGGYCAGKNEVADILAKRGWEVVDVDTFGHAAIVELKDQLIEVFGADICASDGSIDRKRLGRLVFADKRAMKKLEGMIHPIALSILDRKIQDEEKRGTARFCINAALLYRSPHVRLCEAIIEVRAPLYQRVLRAMRRDGLSTSAAIERIESQKGLWSLRPEKDIPIFSLWNAGTHDDLVSAASLILEKLTTHNKIQPAL